MRWLVAGIAWSKTKKNPGEPGEHAPGCNDDDNIDNSIFDDIIDIIDFFFISTAPPKI